MFQESTNNANFTQEKISPVRFRRKFIIFYDLHVQELLVNLNYSDPQDAESDLQVVGNVNQAYEAEDIVHDLSGHHVPRHQVQPKLSVRAQPAPASYKVKFGQDIYYCKPYQPFHTQLRYNFSGQYSV